MQKEQDQRECTHRKIEGKTVQYYSLKYLFENKDCLFNLLFSVVCAAMSRVPLCHAKNNGFPFITFGASLISLCSSGQRFGL